MEYQDYQIIKNIKRYQNRQARWEEWDIEKGYALVGGETVFFDWQILGPWKMLLPVAAGRLLEEEPVQTAEAGCITTIAIQYPAWPLALSFKIYPLENIQKETVEKLYLKDIENMVKTEKLSRGQIPYTLWDAPWEQAKGRIVFCGADTAFVITGEGEAGDESWKVLLGQCFHSLSNQEEGKGE